MAVKIIADIHGEYGALARQLDPGDTAVLLGDYVNLLDFRSLEGILAEVYTRNEIIAALSELTKGRTDRARRAVSEGAGGDPEKLQKVRSLIRESYQEFFECLPCECLMLYGNTDDPLLMRELSNDKTKVLDACLLELSGQRFGFISGSPRGPWSIGLPGEIDPEQYSEKVQSLGRVDVLCTHFPPAIPEITWDKIAGRDEQGSRALLSYLDRHCPSYHYFGHVHNPRVSSVVYGSTKVINAGFFRERRTAIVHCA